MESSTTVVSNNKNAGAEKQRPTDEVADALSSPEHGRAFIEDAEALYSVNIPLTTAEVEARERSPPPGAAKPKPYPAFGFEILSSLIPGSIFGVLVRLGLLAITTYDGQSIFSLAWVQATGCFVMGLTLGLKDEIGTLFVIV